MLELRPNCENCDKDLPPESTQACICSYECTFCTICVNDKLHNVCPNCGGGFVARPIRPKTERRPGVNRIKQPASTKRVHTQYNPEQLSSFCNAAKNIDPEYR